jgi:phosphoserine phosphatase RsbU/P
MQTVPADRGLSQLLLFRPPVSPADVDVHAISIPAKEFTGDFFYTHRQGERLWFALGDVSGKGIGAAVFMAMIQEELEHRIGSCAITACDPALTMQRLHEFLRSVMPSNKFATVVIGHLHDDGTLTITNAGHCPPMIVRNDGTLQEVGSTGPVTGILPLARWSSVHLKLDRGESLVLYSDGLAEAPSPSDEEFGTARIRNFLRNKAGATARAIADGLLHSLQNFTGGVRADDLTIVVLRRPAQ